MEKLSKYHIHTDLVKYVLSHFGNQKYSICCIEQLAPEGVHDLWMDESLPLDFHKRSRF